MKTKKYICIVAAIMMLCLVAACGGNGSGNDSNYGDTSNSTTSGGGGSSNSTGSEGGNSGNAGGAGDTDNTPPTAGEDAQSNLAGTAVEVLDQLVTTLDEMGVEMPPRLPGPPAEVDPDMSQNTVGLSETDFGRLVVSAAHSQAAIGTFAHQIIIIQATDERAATEVKRIVTSDGGYNAEKWICVFPERAVAIESGSYVLIAAVKANIVDAVVDAFREMAGVTGEAVTFWEFIGGDIDAGGGGMAPAPMPIG